MVGGGSIIREIIATILFLVILLTATNSNAAAHDKKRFHMHTCNTFQFEMIS